MDKKGVVFYKQVRLVFYLILAVLVVFTLIQRSRYVVSEEQYVEAYSKHIAMTVNTLLYSDYETEVDFIILDMFKVEILDDKVRVSTTEHEKEYDFILDSKFKIGMERSENRLILRKVKI